MTEKQFTVGEHPKCDGYYKIWDDPFTKEYTGEEIVELLNEQHKTIQQLKQQVDSLIEQLNHKTNLELIEDRKHLFDDSDYEI